MTTVHGSNAIAATVTRMDRVVATINRVMYPAWAGIAIYRESSLALALAALFRGGAVPAQQVRMINAGVLAGTVCAIAEMAVTAAVFCRSVFRYSENHARIEACSEGHARFMHTLGTARMHARRVMPADDGCVDDAERERRTEVELPSGADVPAEPDADGMHAPLLDGHAHTGGPTGRQAEGIAAQMEDYAAHRAATAASPEHQRQLRDDGLAFGRDTVAQGGLVGSNLALLWHACDVSQLLQLPADVVSVTAATLSGSICSLVMGVFHIVAAAVSWKSASRLRELARNARDVLLTLQNKVTRAFHFHDPARHADYEAALPVCAALLHHAAYNETEAIRCARHRIFASKCRMAFGTTSLVLGGISLVLMLVLGTVTTGGLMLGMAGLLAGLAWLTNATIKSHRHAASLSAAVDELSSLRASVPSLDQAIRDAVELLDPSSGRGKAYPVARKLIKRMLMDLGMARSDFKPLKWAPGAVRDAVRAELADTICRYVAGDAMRRALNGVAPEIKAFVQAR